MAVDTLCWPKFLYWCVGCRKPLHTSLAGKSCTSDVWIPNETRQIIGYATKPSLDGKPDSPPLAGGEWLGSRPPAKLAYSPNKCGRFNLDESTQKPPKPPWMCFNPVLSTTFPWHSSPKKLAAWKVAFAMANTTEHEAWRGFWVPVWRIMKPLNVENKTKAMFRDCDECHLAMPVFFFKLWRV